MRDNEPVACEEECDPRLFGNSTAVNNRIREINIEQLD